VGRSSTLVHPLASTPSPTIHNPQYDSSPWSSSGSAVNAAIEDLQKFTPTFLHDLADLWFKETQPWLPILNWQHIQVALESLPSPINRIDDIVLRAVIALTVAYSSQAISLGYRGRRRLSLYLRSEVLVEALAKPSSTSLQALLIIAILDWGSDDISSTFSLLSVCRRICEQIGFFRRLMNQIELESPSNIVPPPQDACGRDELAVPLTWATLATDSSSAIGCTWRDSSAALSKHLSSIAATTTPDIRDSFRTHVHLCAIGLQPLHSFINEFEDSLLPQSEAAALAECDEMYRQLMAYVPAQVPTSYTLLADGAVDFDINTVLTRILTHSSVIIMYQRFVNSSNLRLDAPPHIAVQRCLQACEDIIMVIRNLSDADTELNAPGFASRIYDAARFKLAVYRATGQPREPGFDILMHGLSMCARRWPVARRLDIVLRAAIVEIDTRIQSSLPTDFWDLRKTDLDISDQFKQWIQNYKPFLYVGILNGLYG
jgi:hypothetical protein